MSIARRIQAIGFCVSFIFGNVLSAQAATSSRKRIHPRDMTMGQMLQKKDVHVRIWALPTNQNGHVSEEDKLTFLECVNPKNRISKSLWIEPTLKGNQTISSKGVVKDHEFHEFKWYIPNIVNVRDRENDTVVTLTIPVTPKAFRAFLYYSPMLVDGVWREGPSTRYYFTSPIDEDCLRELVNKISAQEQRKHEAAVHLTQSVVVNQINVGEQIQAAQKISINSAPVAANTLEKAKIELFAVFGSRFAQQGQVPRIPATWNTSRDGHYTIELTKPDGHRLTIEIHSFGKVSATSQPRLAALQFALDATTNYALTPKIQANLNLTQLFTFLRSYSK